MERAPSAPPWIGLLAQADQLTALRYDAEGVVLERRHLPLAPLREGREALLETLAQRCADWLQAAPHTALVGAGLSTLLPPEVAPPAAELPLELAQLPARISRLHLPGGQPLFVLPDLNQAGILPVRLSGGVAALLGVVADGQLPDLLIGLLEAEQLRWVRLSEGRLRRVVQFITPTLQRLLSPAGHDAELDWHAGAFDFGLAVARGEDQQAGMLASLGSPDALTATGQLAAAEQGSFRRGLLIGHELLGLKRIEADAGADCPVILIGPEEDCQRYARALQLFGFAHVERARHSSARGLWQLTRQLSPDLRHGDA